MGASKFVTFGDEVGGTHVCITAEVACWKRGLYLHSLHENIFLASIKLA